MNMIRTEAARITDTCYAHKIAYNKYLPQFSATTILIYNHNFIISTLTMSPLSLS